MIRLFCFVPFVLLLLATKNRVVRSFRAVPVIVVRPRELVTTTRSKFNIVRSLLPHKTLTPSTASLTTTKSSTTTSLRLCSTITTLAAVPREVWTSVLPPCFGFYKSEFTVSYGYGFATALSALSIFWQYKTVAAAAGNNAGLLLTWHAAALMFYGTRLSIFLTIRNIWSKRIQEFNQRVEQRALARGNRFATRAPFILSCGLLYYGLCAPLVFTAQLLFLGNSGVFVPWAMVLLQGLVGMQWVGFLVAALGDWTKTHVKRSEGNEKFLVTSGIFSVLRHPNYTGEIVGWTANAVVGFVAAALLMSQNQYAWKRGIADLLCSVVSLVGIVFVLMRATGNLEARQKTDYGTDAKYQEWVDSTWGGWYIPATAAKKESQQVNEELFGT